jgi:hypothetical protein
VEIVTGVERGTTIRVQAPVAPHGSEPAILAS